VTDKAVAEVITWRLSHSWYDGLGLEYSGVALGDCMEYNLLTVLNRLMLQYQAQAVLKDADVKAEAPQGELTNA